MTASLCVNYFNIHEVNERVEECKQSTTKKGVTKKIMKELECHSFLLLDYY